MEKARSADDARWDDLKQAVEAAVEEGRVFMERQALRSVEEFNNDTEYSKMLHEAVQVRALPLLAWLVQPKADTDATNSNQPPPLMVAMWGRFAALGLELVNAGADSLRSWTFKCRIGSGSRLGCVAGLPV